MKKAPKSSSFRGTNREAHIFRLGGEFGNFWLLLRLPSYSCTSERKTIIPRGTASFVACGPVCICKALNMIFVSFGVERTIVGGLFDVLQDIIDCIKMNSLGLRHKVRNEIDGVSQV